MTSIFGPIITGNDVEVAAADTLKLWLPTYLAEMERLTDRDPGTLKTIGFWDTVNEFPAADTITPPAGFVVSPGLAGPPENRGDGRVDAWFRIGIGVIIVAGTREATNEIAKLYGAAIFTLLGQRPSLGGFAQKLELVDLVYDDVPSDYLPVGATVQIVCNVLVAEITNRLAGPGSPVEPPALPEDWPTAETVDIDITRRSVT